MTRHASAQSEPNTPPAKLVVLLSGRGRNLEAIIAAIEQGWLKARIALVISNRAGAPGLRIAKLAGLACTTIESRAFANREAFDQALGNRVAAENPDWIALAGFMRILSAGFIQRFKGRIVNIHPSLLPRYKGLDTHERALANGDARHGATVHFVTDALDAGPIIRQASIAVRGHDTPQTLADRLMARVERRLYPAALMDLVNGRVVQRDGRIWRDGRLQTHCPHSDGDSSAA